MKLKCDLCGQSLEVAAGGQQAACSYCGLTYCPAVKKHAGGMF